VARVLLGAMRLADAVALGMLGIEGGGGGASDAAVVAALDALFALPQPFAVAGF
jgi:hypothetical protein